jgi:hypothetical protein
VVPIDATGDVNMTPEVSMLRYCLEDGNALGNVIGYGLGTDEGAPNVIAFPPDPKRRLKFFVKTFSHR